ncbi:hypothetical protein Btru_054714, partial [Bulinus truncatus]
MTSNGDWFYPLNGTRLEAIVWFYYQQVYCKLTTGMGDNYTRLEEQGSEEFYDTVDYIQSDTVDYIQSDTVDYIQSDTVDYIQNDTVDYIQSDTVDYIQSDTVDYIQKDTVDYIQSDTVDYIQSDTVDYIQSDTVDYIQSDTVDYIQSDTVDYIQNDTGIVNAGKTRDRIVELFKSYQLRALIWRNFLIRFRNRFSLILELGSPLLFCALVELVFLISPTYFNEEHVFPSRPIEDFSRNHANELIFLPETPATLKLMREGAGQETPKPSPIKHPKDRYGHPVVVLDFDDENDVPKSLKFQVFTTNYDGTSHPFYHFGSGVLFLQYVLTKIFINYWQKQPNAQGPPPNERFYIQMLPIPPGHENVKHEVLSYLEVALPYLFLGLVCTTALCIVKDKENKNK